MQAYKIYIVVSAASALNLYYADAQTPRPVPSPYSASAPVNYVRTFEAKIPMTNPAQVDGSDPLKTQQTTQYLDGLGRPLQTVVKQASPLKNDVVSAIEYDEFGREAYKYLPFASTTVTAGGGATNDGLFKRNAFQQQQAFYNTQLAGQNQTVYYGYTRYEASPLNRVIEAYAPGNSWTGSSLQPNESDRHGVDTRYAFNMSSESVYGWTVSDNPGTFGTYVAFLYGAGELSKVITEDEQEGQVIEFKDKEGKIVLKKVRLTVNRDLGGGQLHGGFMSTYYMYDDLGRLRGVMQPEGVRTGYVLPGAFTDTAVLNGQCFRYEYDGRNRMIMKQAPGKGTEEMVYDARDRLIMSRDSSLRKQGYWNIFKYDELNRLIKIGLVYNTGTRAAPRPLPTPTWPTRR